MEMKLNKTSISKIRTQITVPSYNRQSLKTGIIHIGVGGFHRSHRAYYIHQLLENYSDWAICGVGLREADRNIGNILKKARLPLHFSDAASRWQCRK